MARTVGDMLGALAEQIPLSKAAGWDPVGLQLGAADAPARRVAVAHEITEPVVARVEGDAVDLVLTYHPLLFRSTNRLTAGRSPEGRAYRLIRHGAAVAVVHTAYDVAPMGTATSLAEALGLSSLAGFAPLWPVDAVKVIVFAPEADADALMEAMSAAGAGDIGAYSSCSFRVSGTGTFLAPESASPSTGRAGEMNREPELRLEMIAPKRRADDVVAALVSAHRYEEPAFDVVDVAANAGFVGRVGELATPVTLQAFARRIEERLESPVRVAGPAKRTIERAAVVPGSGASFLRQAAAVADVLVTGDVRHHDARAALDLGLAVVDAGHTATERPGIRLLASLVSGMGDDVVDLTGIDPNPWRE